MEIAAVKLARDVSGDADAGGSGAGVGHGARDLRPAVIDGGDRGLAAVPARDAGIPQCEVLDEAGERHDVVQAQWRYS